MSRNTDVAIPHGRDMDTPRERPAVAPPLDGGSSPLSRPVFLLGVVVFIVALFLPMTGWILRLQLRVAMGGGLPKIGQMVSGSDGDATVPTVTPEKKREFNFAAKHPDDFEIQLANAIQSVPSTDPIANIPQSIRRVDSLIHLQDRFGNRPEFHATILRFLCQGMMPSMLRDRNGLLEVQDENTPSYKL